MQVGFNQEDYDDIEKVTNSVTDLFPDFTLDECDKDVKIRMNYGGAKTIVTKSIKLAFRTKPNTSFNLPVPVMLKSKDDLQNIIPKEYVSCVFIDDDTITVYFVKRDKLPYGEYVE